MNKKTVMQKAEAGKYLADFGLQVHLTPEGAGYEIYATHSYVKDGKTHYKFPEGKINMFTFEQKTPDKIESSVERSVRQAILHANSRCGSRNMIFVAKARQYQPARLSDNK